MIHIRWHKLLSSKLNQKGDAPIQKQQNIVCNKIQPKASQAYKEVAKIGTPKTKM